MMPEWITILNHRGYDIKVLQGAGADDDHGYKVDSWVVWAHTYPTVAAAVAVIDQIVDGV